MNTRHTGSYIGHKALMMALFGGTGEPPAWRAEAACADQDPELFQDSDRAEQGRAVCAGCPVLTRCRADQFEWESRSRARRYYTQGMTGGLTASQRNQRHYPRTDRKNTTSTAPASANEKDVA